MVDITVGQFHTAPNARHDVGFIAPGQMRGCTFNPTSQHLWLHTLGIWGGKNTNESASNVTARVGVYAVDGSLNPATQLGYSAAMTISTAMPDDDPSAGASNTASVESSTGPVLTSIPMASGTRPHFSVLGTVGYLSHAMAAAGLISADNEKFYNRSGLSQPPPDPFGSYSSSTEGHMTIWAVGEINVAPNTPTGLSPSGTIQDLVPTFECEFADANETYGDALNQFRIQVRRKSDQVSFWDVTLTATSIEEANAEFSRTYGGTTLVRGTEYEWRTQMSDYFNTWSNWSDHGTADWTSFTPSALGLITLDGAPEDKIPSNTPTFEGRWTHQSAVSMKTVIVDVLNAAGTTVIKSGVEYNIADVDSSAAPGTLFNVPYANTGFATPLPWGTSLTYRMKGYDGTQWSDWSALRSFSTNAAPSIPSNLSPNGGPAPYTDYPLLKCDSSDPDGDFVDMEVFAEIRDDGGTVLFTRDMVKAGGGSQWQYQTTGTDLATFDDYLWTAYSYDGTLYSGEKTSSATATRSAQASFTYATGPSIAMVAPTADQVLTGSSLFVDWTLSVTQFGYQILIYDDTGDLVYDTGLVISATTQATLTDNPAILNGRSYTVSVVGYESIFLYTQSESVAFSVDYPEVTPVANPTIDVISVGSDLWPSAFRITWDQTEYSTDDWANTTIKGQASGGPDTELTTYETITSPSQTSFTFYTPASGHEYTFSISQSINEGVEVLISEPVTVAATVTLGGVVICSVMNPEDIRTALRYTSERDFSRSIGEAVYQSPSLAHPTTVRTRQRVVQPEFDAQVFDDAVATAAQRRDEIEAIDDDNGTFCYRDNHGRKLFLTWTDITITDQVPNWYLVKLRGRQEYFREGES